MDWKASNFDWNRVRAFLVTAEEGSLSAAARALGSTQPTIGRQVTRLEEELGVALFERIGTRLELTPTGLNLVEQARAMGESAMKLSLAAAGHSQTIEGTVSITASEAVATYLLPPVIHKLRRDHPKIEIEIVASNESQDLHRREADIAVRNYAPKHDDLIGRKVGVSLGKFYATPAYINEFGPFDKPEDLSRGEIFAFDRSEMMISWLCGMGMEVTRENFPIMTGNHLVQWALCKQGVGICIMMGVVGEAEPLVENILPDSNIPVPIWLVSHRELRTSRRIRLVYDLLADALSDEY